MSSSFSSCSSGACVRRRFWLWHPDAPEWYPQDREGPSTAAAAGAVATAMDGAGRRAHGADDGWLILCARILVFLWYRECPECGVCGGHDGDCTRDSACPGRGLCGDSPPFRGTSLTGLRQLSNAKLDYTPLGRDGAAQEDKKEPTPPSAAKVARRRRRRRRLAEARAAGRAGPPAAGGGSGEHGRGGRLVG